MNKAKITFSNGEMLTIEEGSLLVPINLVEQNGTTFSSQGESFEIYKHTHEGLIPSITEMCLKSSFFNHINHPEKVYKTSSIVSIENM